MKRILIFSLSYEPYVGGAEIALREITNRIDPKEYQFDLICLRWNTLLPRMEKKGNVTVYRIGFTKKDPTPEDLVRFPMYLTKVLYPILAAYKAMQLHRKLPYQALWSMMSYAAFPAVIFGFFNPHVPLIVSLQEGDDMDVVNARLRIKLVLPLYRRIFKKARTIQAISTFLARYAKYMGFASDVAVIPNGVAMSNFSRTLDSADIMRARSNLSDTSDAFLLITTSRLVPKNGVADVIASLALLPPDVEFAILGIGPDERELRKLARAQGVEDRVHFLGQIENSELPAYLKAADVFVRPSLSEGQGISFIEAMAAGIPMIATQVGGLSDFLFDPDRNPEKVATGLAVQPRSPEQIAKAVMRYRADPILAAKIARQAHDFVKDRYDWDVLSLEMKEDVFDKTLNS